MNRKAIIFGIKGHILSKEEKILLKENKPWGIILFSRNVKNINQLSVLVNQIKKTLNDKNYPILIDQEGGKVCRLNNIFDYSFFSQDFFGNLFKENKNIFYSVYKIYIDQVCKILKETGININTVPVLDVRRKDAHKVIGTRSFSNNPDIVSYIGKLCVNFYKKNKIATVIKHIPGHGKASLDSHKNTPIIKAKKKELIKNDFKPFRFSNSLFAMTAHVILSEYDKKNTVTHSYVVIKKVIRGHIKFKGILISDDVSMKALKYTLEDNAIRALNSGCNLVLHCNGKLNEMRKLCKVIPRIDTFTEKKTSHFYKFLR
jgi:beta-N-acetylhexosaminidase